MLPVLLLPLPLCIWWVTGESIWIGTLLGVTDVGDGDAALSSALAAAFTGESPLLLVMIPPGNGEGAARPRGGSLVGCQSRRLILHVLLMRSRRQGGDSTETRGESGPKVPDGNPRWDSPTSKEGGRCGGKAGAEQSLAVISQSGVSDGRSRDGAGRLPAAC
ncbi:hypothetical protein DPEC_G00340800 [Dallia pectoralis]|uniref:Uncharacterized protein n=1 Tax=Dallia pectoralis TaxID=75939 RepID=A0ACC2F569_DALPE|nr:hypothetical protein DPEC_G00340800 [Dallia pectoralis]